MALIKDFRWELSLKRRIIPFQSPSQLVSFFFYLFFAEIFVFALIEILPGDIEKKIFIMAPSIFLSFFPLYEVIPKSFIVEGMSANELCYKAEEKLDKLGYKRCDEQTGFVYFSKLPRIISWKENSVKLVDVKGGCKVIAPKLISKKLHDFCAGLA
ncbi:TPA: hypothetical protein HH295_07120 [Xanthomonas vasicola pv. zeae]|uniref:YcxB family protein n=1 Tax=Xanthomonas vasicola TaxID=56459 RepID=A0ABD7S2Y5_XANVA|nr:hypothetical protein [Xanthomonas vasicola]MBV6745391.1 hypothetical protein [Xanthomonas vasicola pv. vasculorum NCPPB 890]MBV6890795.1 hypothetical protein [Xanthomonas vasicola pv. vasculorum]MDO6946305.1 hypothetical protein [Xanthomonas vasicola]MDO6950921.1 hypothetical protein [Xanthomonas vasicola]MDO6954832.1 hypothetical protein [Xanthomonas vasicola]